MKAIVIGSGTIGSAVRKALEEKGHEVVSVGRKSGDYQADISETESLKTLFSRIGSFDAMANAAGDVSFGALEESTDEQWANSMKFKGMGQINLVRAAAGTGRSPARSLGFANATTEWGGVQWSTFVWQLLASFDKSSRGIQ